MNKIFDHTLLKSIIESEFDFFATVEAGLEKSDSDSKNVSNDRIIYMNSSNEKLDLQGDVVAATGIKESLNFYLKCGKIDYDHKSLIDPRYLIGEPLEGQVTSDGAFLAKGVLYKGLEVADSIYNLLKAGAKLGVSIGGKVLDHKDVYDEKYGRNINKITKVLLNHLAITPYPINVWTSVSVMPWNNFMKSLTTATGSALKVESLEHGGHKELKRDVNKISKIFKEYIKTAKNAPDYDFICPHINTKGQFVNGEHGARRHFTECHDLDYITASELASYIVNNKAKIDKLIRTTKGGETE
jgi:hypothetical protein